MAFTLEANDCQLQCRLTQPSSQLAECSLLVVSLVGSLQSQCQSGQQPLRLSVRMRDMCLSMPDGVGGRGKEQQGVNQTSVLPSSFRHVWGRMVAMGTCFVEVTTHPGCPMAIVPPAPLAVECAVNCGIVEWSRGAAEFVSAVVGSIKDRCGATASQEGGQSRGWSLLEMAKCGSFQLRVSNLNCIAAEECGDAHTVLLVHTDVLHAANRPGGREAGGGKWWECEALRCVEAGVSGLAVCAEALEARGKVRQVTLGKLLRLFTVCLCTQVFPCLLVSDLPLGVLEVPQVSVEVHKRDSIVSACCCLGNQAIIQAASLVLRM